MEGAPVHLRSLYLGVGETEVAHVLDQIALAMPHVLIGSYPQFDSSIGYRVKVTVEHSHPEPVNDVVDQLVQRLPAGARFRVGGTRADREARGRTPAEKKVRECEPHQL